MALEQCHNAHLVSRKRQPRNFHLSLVLIQSVLLIAFYAALMWETMLSENANSGKIRGIFTMGAGGALGFGAYGLGQETTSSAAGATILLFSGIVVAPVVLTGFGLFIGSLIKRFLPRGNWQKSAISIVLASPIILVLWTKYTTEQLQAERLALAEAQLAAFQQTNVQGSLGGYPVRLPGTPLIDTYFDCSYPDEKITRRCQSHFRFHAGQRLPENSPAVFQKLIVSERAETCERRCVPFDELASWCSVRPDMQESVWCDRITVASVHFSLEPSLQPRHSGFENWMRMETGSDDVALYCLMGWDGRRCRAMFELATGIHAVALFKDPDMAGLSTQAIEMRAYSERLWSAMTGF